MEKNEFKAFCKKEFESFCFKKIGPCFYFLGKDLLCEIDLQKSNYSNSYYVNFLFYIGCFNNPKEYPRYYNPDVDGRIIVMSKSQTINGKHFLTGAIEYEEYTEEELHPYFDKAFKELILPPIQQGKKYILNNLGTLYTLGLNREKVMEKLQS